MKIVKEDTVSFSEKYTVSKAKENITQLANYQVVFAIVHVIGRSGSSVGRVFAH